ncbi:NACHT, LRR and PYD domains-containing protein 1 homolog [Epinephelus moara]|uniref:NACHT, LRR and PYD domains-containing protein 1 homolog n=1 Tax=Epinephelus moara TaxID=300413 RepID=UPI00214F11F8|nr:NACHT, LRR and PYD domains-containing protein 1 homolog [Epinephelus moara]
MLRPGPAKVGSVMSYFLFSFPSEKHQSKPLQKVVTRTSLMEKLLETLKDLSYGELEQFKHVLQHTRMKKGLPKISSQRMEMADRDEIVELMVEIYGKQSVEVTREVLMEMNMTDMAESLPEISSGSKGPSGSSELEGCGSVTQDSSDWTKLDPEVNCTDADEAPTYSLQSGAGNFECSVSGLRWVCEEKVSFKYQFCSLSGPMERIESMKYMPAGPLMDITVIAGKLDVVYLPHWICIDDNPTILDKFAVLHIDDCGDVVEKVSEVTSSHVKLSEPVFSLKMVLVKLGLSVEINCKVLIYKTDTPFLTLHVYLIPPDPALKQELENIDGYKRIRKPHPVRPLKMHDWFTLTADLDGAKICPETLMLIYESTEPNFFEVFIKNPDTDFVLELQQKNELQPLWTRKIKKDEYQSTGHKQEKHSVDKHQEAADGKTLFKMLKELTDEEFKEFKWYLLRISKSQRQNTDRVDLVDMMLQTYTQESVEVAKDILKEIGRNYLVQLLSDTSSGSDAAGSSA